VANPEGVERERMIRGVTESDASAICEIYNEYVLNTRISFEESPVSTGEMAERIRTVTQQYPWLVSEGSGEVEGYIYASRWKERSAYRYSVELGIYIASGRVGKGIGSMLMVELLKELRARSIHSVISGIALPNPASVALCEKFGFVKVAQFKEVGFKQDSWVDVGYWELVT
jgi:L-amino acid N-acyltransferase YncA